MTPPLPKVCPECAGPLLSGRTAMACAHCGWSRVDPDAPLKSRPSKLAKFKKPNDPKPEEPKS